MTAPRTNASHDQNFVPTLLGVSTADGTTPVPAEVDPLTGRLYVDASLTTPVTGTFVAEPTFKDDPTDAGETPKYGKTNSSTHKQQVEADVSGTVTANLGTLNGAATSAKQDTGNTSLSSIDGKLTDVATQTTLALIKAKTDNIDVAISTRTKPADQQHVIVDSSALPSGAATSAKQLADNHNVVVTSAPIITVTGPLTDTQLRAAPVPVSGTVTANAGTNLNTSALTLDTTTVTTNTEIGGLTETAPATDTASSGLNGRLQRIAQRLTSIIALLPGSLGQKARAASLAVTLSTEDVTALTPPAAITGFATASNQLFGLMPKIFDALTYTATSGTVDTYQYYTGGTGGSLVATLTVTFTASDHLILVSVART